VASAQDIDPPLISREIKQQEDGLISRAADGVDRSANLVQATAADRRTRQVPEGAGKNIDASVRTWNRRDLEQLAGLLERFALDVTTPASENSEGEKC
jgi:hypothetical protein